MAPTTTAPALPLHPDVRWAVERMVGGLRSVPADLPPDVRPDPHRAALADRLAAATRYVDHHRR